MELKSTGALLLIAFLLLPAVSCGVLLGAYMLGAGAVTETALACSCAVSAVLSVVSICILGVMLHDS